MKSDTNPTIRSDQSKLFQSRALICFSISVSLLLTGCISSLDSLFSRPVEASYRAVAVQKGDTLYRISKRYDVNLRDLIHVNKVKPPFKIYPGQGLILPKKRIHIVRKFETVESIATSRNMSQSELVRINGLRAPYTLYENQRLKLPTPYGSSSTQKPSDIKKAFLPRKKATEKTEAKPNIKNEAKTASTQKTFKPGDQSWKDSFVAPDKFVTQQSKTPIEQKSYDKEDLLAVPHKPSRQSQSSTRHFPTVKDNAYLAPTKPSFGAKKAVTHSTSKATPKASTTTVAFKWPVRGKIISKYGALQEGLKNDGINISAKLGTPVRASESGRVVYAGNALKGYGNLVLMKHRQGYITTYAHMKTVSITKGQSVKKGDIIGFVGKTGTVRKPQLHFEIRKKRQTLDPIKLLK